MGMRHRMVKKLADVVERFHMRAPAAWMARVDAWRKKQPFPPPSRSEAIRELVAQALDAAESKGKKKAP
jgi:hypothetical protein